MERRFTALAYRKIKGYEVLHDTYCHNYRVDGYASNSDITKQYLNEELVKGYPVGRTYGELLCERIKQSPYYKKTSVRRDAVLAVEFVVSFSRGAIENEDLLGAWKQANLEFFRDKYGKNLISMTYHDDELTEHPDGVVPHIHVLLFPFSSMGSLRLKTIIPRNYALTLLHTEYAKAMAPFGLSRGVYGSKARHLDPWEYHQLFDEEIENYKAGLPVREIGDTDLVYQEKLVNYSERALRERIRLLFEANSEIGRLNAELENVENDIDLDEIIARAQKNINSIKINDRLGYSKNFLRTFEHLGLDICDVNKNTIEDIKKARSIASLGHTVQYLIDDYPDRALAREIFNSLMRVRAYMKEQQRNSNRENNDLTI